MPLKVQWGLADVHGIGLGTWSLPETMALGRAHMDGTLTTHTHTHYTPLGRVHEAQHTQNAHHTHTVPTPAPTYAHRHTCSPYSLAFVSNLLGSGPHGYGQSWTGCSSRPGGGLCWALLFSSGHQAASARTLPDTRPLSVQTTALQSSLSTGCSSADFPLSTGYVADLRSALPTQPLR